VDSVSNLGKAFRLERLFDRNTRRTMIVPIDDSLIFGPSEGLSDMRKKIGQIVNASPNGILAFMGTFKNNADLVSDIGKIINLTASTTRSQHTRKVIVGTVKQAVASGMDCVAVHVNLTSSFEREMIHNLGVISSECEEYGMPLMAIMYPRREHNGTDDNYERLKKDDLQMYTNLVAHAGRVGVELGADLIKTPFTGDTVSFRKVVEACAPIPVVIAGGPVQEPIGVFYDAHAAIEAGAAGVSFGRNIFNRDDSSRYVRVLKKVVHEDLDPQSADRMISTNENA